jgi:hypothetical protein
VDGKIGAHVTLPGVTFRDTQNAVFLNLFAGLFPVLKQKDVRHFGGRSCHLSRGTLSMTAPQWFAGEQTVNDREKPGACTGAAITERL